MPKDSRTVTRCEGSKVPSRNDKIGGRRKRNGQNLRQNTRLETAERRTVGNRKHRESRRVIEQPLRDKWLNIKWITHLASNYPTLSFGVDNVNVNVNPRDLGSIIAFALTQNIYLEGLAKLEYMGLHEILNKQQKKNS